MFIKLGELIELAPEDIQTQESVLSAFSDQEITKKFKKFAEELKIIAPKANDFLYFSAVMMHAAEASTVNPDGTPKKLPDGTIVKAFWNKEGGTWKWESNDPSLKPYKNSNGDIFPEEELIKAHKKWVGKPLCVDHKSNSVDAIRGVILDTYYDRKLKRVVALCALDKITYPDLAKKVAAGYATCVSMGTAVGRAICSDCGQVARAEVDFCNHMRTKSCYGEINIDLNPIELSIVVNGADPNAKIRTILAAAYNLNKYIEKKEDEFVSLANNDKNISKLEDLELEVQKIADKISEIKNSLELEESSTVPYGMTGDKEMPETVLPNEDFNLDFPEKVIASDVSKALTDLKDVVESKLNNMEQHIKVLSYKIKEEIMSDTKEKMNKQAYFQGGGGVNEPTPGQVKYEKDPLAEKVRFEDKQMVGQDNLDTGPVDGMHPGHDSAGVSDLERKKMLARAEAEERSLRRAVALEKAKQAYFQGGGGVNEPTPGKSKYEKDPLAEKSRKGDKVMVGQKPFPEVGDVDGLHPSPESSDEKDELKRKQMLSRATPLKARFVKAANTDGSEDKDNSAWQVFVDDKLALSATVKEISGGNTEVLYDTIATKEFGSKILAKVKEVGLAKAASLYKKSQAVSDVGTQPVTPVETGGAAPVPPSAGDEAASIPATEIPEAPQMEAKMEEPEATDKSGDVKETVLDLISKLKEDISDLDEAVKSLVGEQAEMGDAANLEATASDELASLHQMRKDLNQGLIDGLSKSVDELSEHKKELELIASMLDDGTLDLNEEYANFVVQDAVSDAKSALSDARNLKKAFVKYARGTEALLLKQAQMVDAADESDADMVDLEDAEEIDDCDMLEDEDAEKDTNDVKLEIEVPDADISKMIMEKAKLASLDSKEARAAARAKLAQSVEMSSVLDEAHPKGGTQTELDVKPSDELGKVEDLKEQHDKSVEIAQAPVKVRKDAERIQKLVSEGKLDPARVDELIAHGVDADAVKYWKQYFAEADKESSQFAVELVKEHVKAELDEQMKVYRVKIARAYETAYDMVLKGLLANDRSAISAQVDDIMKWNDEAFDSFKRVIAAKSAIIKKAGIPLVGQLGSEDPFSVAVEKEDLRSQLEKAFSGKKY